MSETLTEVKNLLNGGEFLVKSSNFQDVFTPEDLNEEQLMIVDTVKSFVETEITPIYDRIEHQEPGLTESLLAKAGELGLLGLAIPEEYGGMGKDFNTNSLLVENLAKSRSFSLSLGAHIGIGTLPIVYFGNEQQKTHYLPKLASGELKACYCLTEPSSGSDALGAKTVAILNEEGTHYIVNGQKMWITNSGFADVFIVFCQIGGDKFSCLILEKDMP
ncbi:MAG TPA: acyl-CoA dehydrogenase family protein, partial [Chitinophagales bacterium]|nr:acyl-CoA dehydrogenase family protein [Chitinophagales bacterium]